MIQLSLKKRVYLANAILLVITVIGAILMIWYTYKTEKIFKDIIDKNLIIYQSAESLANSLINQKGFVSYFLLDKNPDWLDELKPYREIFKTNLEKVRKLAEEDWEKKAVEKITSRYADYVSGKDQVIELYKSGDFDNGSVLHKKVRGNFFEILKLCEQFKQFHKNRIAQAIEISQKESNQLRHIAILAIITVILLSLLINYIFARHILDPIKKLAAEADRQGGSRRPVNEVAALQRSVHDLIENEAQAHQDLKRSQETLMQSEKMALLGKLAAGTAHSIRNPLTSVKMRLFSLNRSCGFSHEQQEDFTVISEEIKQINKIVENFLEFARPPRLDMKLMSPSTVVDRTLHLLEQRLKSYKVDVQRLRKEPLCPALIDPEQLKEVMVNLIINACEAMKIGGSIIISEEENYVEPLKKVAVIRIIDNGPGIPESIQKKIFDPFFTTKAEGTGLGLSIAFKIIDEHGGWLDLSSREGDGASFIITLPLKEN